MRKRALGLSAALLVVPALVFGAIGVCGAVSPPSASSTVTSDDPNRVVSTYLVYDRPNGDASITKGRLKLYGVRANGTESKLFSERAGSGLRGHKNACHKGKGWLPKGRYRITRYQRHRPEGGNAIAGIAWQLENKRCKPGGTLRDALFIHSEMRKNWKNHPSIERFRWDGARDYRSAGCVKVSRKNAIKLAGILHQPRMPNPRTLTVKK